MSDSTNEVIGHRLTPGWLGVPRGDPVHKFALSCLPKTKIKIKLPFQVKLNEFGVILPTPPSTLQGQIILLMHSDGKGVKY